MSSTVVGHDDDAVPSASSRLPYGDGRGIDALCKLVCLCGMGGAVRGRAGAGTGAAGAGTLGLGRIVSSLPLPRADAVTVAVVDPWTVGRFDIPLRDGVRELTTRRITSLALTGPQCEAMISNRGFGCGVGRGDHIEAELCRLMTARAVVSRVVCTSTIPSTGLAMGVPSELARLEGDAVRGNPECR